MTPRPARPSAGPRALAARLRGVLRRLGPVRRAAEATRQRRSVATVRESGWFDEAWYREQAGGELPLGVDPVEHYVTIGSRRGWQPHPLFDPGHYLAASGKAATSTAEPFAEFIDRGARRGDDPHPLFDTEHYLAVTPEAARHPRGAFGHFLEHGLRVGGAPSPVVGDRTLPAPRPGAESDPAPAPEAGGDPYLAAVRRVAREHAAVDDHTGFARTFSTFDHDRAATFVQRMGAVARGLADPPTVSVVLPTRDRGDVLPQAIDSVLAQSWPHLELLVVDDGSVDDTAEVVAGYADPRVRYLPQPGSGVSRARNHGLERSTGSIVAYLDSDNIWEPEFLEVMVGFLADEGVRAAHAGLEMHLGDGRVEYRGREVELAALLERNYVDCNTFVHERRLIAEVGGFDEELRRVVDWDLIIRVAAATRLGYAPFIGARYAHERDRDDRITLHESVGYRHVVRGRHLVDLDRAPRPVAGRCSAVLVVRSRPAAAVRRLHALADGLTALGLDHELVVVDAGLEHAEALRLRLAGHALPSTIVHRVADPPSLAVARNLGASLASGGTLLFLDPAVSMLPDDLARLVTAVDGGLDLAQPTLLDLEGTIRSTGQMLGPAATPVTLGGGLAGDDLALSGTVRDGVEGYVFAAVAGVYRELGGVDPLFVHGGGDLDLGLRASARGARVGWVPEAVAELRRRETDDTWSPSRADRRELLRRWGADQPALEHREVDEGLRVSGLEPLPGESWKQPARWRPVYARAAGPRRWAIKICAAEVAERRAWGDWHFARALRRALLRRGEHAVVDCRKAWYRPTAHLEEVNLFLRGTQPFDPAPDRVNLCWIISHPDRVTWDELAAYDHVLAASLGFPDELRRRYPDLDVPISPLLQCTDPEVFYPEPVPELAEELLFVGNSRGALRPIVRDAIAAGLEPAIHGQGWEELVPTSLVRSTYLANEQLRRHYSSAGVVLNDHWPDMRRHGFLSNRIFDAAACGAHVVSDEVEGLAAIFGDQVTVAADGAFPVDVLSRAAEAHGRAAAGSGADARGVFDPARHSFDERARRLIEIVDGLSS